MKQDARAYWRDARPYEYSNVLASVSDNANDDDDNDDGAIPYQTTDSWGIMLIYSFFKPSGEGDETELKVQLLVARHSPIEAIFKFHSSTYLDIFQVCLNKFSAETQIACVMNVIAYNQAYSLYPAVTFEKRTSLVTLKRAREKDFPSLEKYVRRGWRILYHLSPEDEPAYALGSCWVNDEHSWVIDLPDLPDFPNAKPAPTPHSHPLRDDPVAATNWSLLNPSKPFINYRLLISNSLYYEYIISDLEAFGYFQEEMWSQFMSESLKDMCEAHSPLTSRLRHRLRVWYVIIPYFRSIR
jgi:hypothetical protein